MKNTRSFPSRASLLATAGMLMMAGLTACSSGGPQPKAAYADSSKAGLFSIPKEQMEHVSVVTVEPQDFPRVLRLTGTVAFNGFQTTPVITQVSGPVSRLVVSPGQ
ncbi:MAG: hypothetical protein ACM3SW_17905, partial [Actinomycetota bacterium]